MYNVHVKHLYVLATTSYHKGLLSPCASLLWLLGALHLHYNPTHKISCIALPNPLHVKRSNPLPTTLGWSETLHLFAKSNGIFGFLGSQLPKVPIFKSKFQV
jgi:hypothetical protein